MTRKPLTSTAYKPIVLEHLPMCEGNELSGRCEMLKMRDQATVAMQNCGDVSGPVLEHITWLATRYGLEPMSVDALILLGSQMRNLQETASMMMIFEMGEVK